MRGRKKDTVGESKELIITQTNTIVLVWFVCTLLDILQTIRFTLNLIYLRFLNINIVHTLPKHLFKMPFPLIFWATNLHFSSTYKLSTWIPLCNLKLYTEDSFIYHSVTDGIFYFQKHNRNWLLCLLTESSDSWKNKEVVSKSFTVKTCNSNKMKQEFRTWIYLTIFTGWQGNAQILRFRCVICPCLTTFLKTSIAKIFLK